MAAGMGGGSSDAAWTLLALIKLWRLDVSCATLRRLAERLGSDVPFFLYGGTALVEGRGERVTPLSAPMSSTYVLARPRIEVSTRDIFARLPRSAWTDGSATRELANSISREGDARLGQNGLQSTVAELFPSVQQCLDDVAAACGGRSILSGSGPTVVGVVPAVDAGERAAALAKQGYWAVVAQNYVPRELPCP